MYKKLILLIILLFVSLQAKELEKVSVQLHWKYQFEFAGFIAACEKGFYKDVGLDVELKEYNHGIDVIDEVLKGKSNYGVYNSNILISHLNDKPVRLMASFFKRSALVIITKPHIKTIDDLVGKTVMAGTKKDFNFNFKYMFNDNNIDINSIKLIPHTYNTKDFLDDKCDAMTAFISDQPYKLDKLGIKYNIIDPSSYGMYNLQLELFTSISQKNKFPKRTKKFKEATVRGWEYALENTDEIIEIIDQKYNHNISKEALKYEAKITQQLILPKIYDIGIIDNNYLKKQLTILKKDMNINNDKSLDSFVCDGNNLNKVSLNLTQKERQYLKNHPTIKAHNEINWAPFNFNKDGEAKGFSVDYMKLLAKKIGINVKFINGYSWSEFMDMLQTKDLDTIINIAYTKQRAKTIDFTDTFYTIENIIYVNKNSPDFNSLDDLEGHTIASVKDFFTQQELAKDRPKIKHILVEDQLQAFKLLSLGKVDAVISEKAIADYLIQNNGLSNMVSTNYIEDTKYIANLKLGTSKQDKVLRDILNKAQKMITTEEINLLKQKWFGVKTQNKTIFTSQEIKYLQEKEEIKVCISQDKAPIEYFENDKPQGITSDLLHIMEDKLKIKFKVIKTSSWNQSQNFLKTRRCDILPHMFKSKISIKYANFTKPYHSSRLAFITQNNKKIITSMKSVKDKLVALKSDSGLQKKFKKQFPSLSIVQVKTPKDLLESVAEGKAYFSVLPLPVYSYFKNQYNFDNLQIAGYSEINFDDRIAIRKDDKILLSIINKILSEIDKNTIDLIYSKWTNITFKETVNYTLLWQLGIVSLFIITIILIFTIKQNKLNKQIQQLNIHLKLKVEEAIIDTQKKEKLLQHQSRLAQMGEMISMIAHQWRQPLTAISSTSNAIVLKAKLNKLDTDMAIELSSKISSYSQHLSSTIDDFREFFKSNKEKKDTTYSEIINAVLAIIETSIENKNITLVKNLNSNIVFNTYQNELKQVILNLIKNAEDVLIEKNIEQPKIIVETNNTTLTISDNGGGISEDIIDKIFDPYFSTKIKKDGTGLGLYMSKTIVEEHCNGKLSVSNDNNGAIFKIILKINNV